MGSVNLVPFSKKAKTGRTTILNRIKIGLGMVLRMNLNIFFMVCYTEIRKGNAEFHRGSFINRFMLVFKILESKFISNPKG